jgi:hypothetical protein
MINGPVVRLVSEEAVASPAGGASIPGRRQCRTQWRPISLRLRRFGPQANVRAVITRNLPVSNNPIPFVGASVNCSRHGRCQIK